MTEDVEKNLRLKKFVQKQMKASLLKVGRKLVQEKGPDFLTARKLSEASNTSVGTIYNLYATMDNFIVAENLQTLQELYQEFMAIIPSANPYVNINRYADVFSNFVMNNHNLWILLYKERLFGAGEKLPSRYCKIICKFEKLLEVQTDLMFGKLSRSERKISLQVLAMAIFALSGFLANDNSDKMRKLDKNNVCKLLLNTYLGGLEGLKRVKNDL